MVKNGTSVGVALFNVIIFVFCVGCWIGNAVKLIQYDDWSSNGNWKGEIVHTAGLVFPLSVITVWVDDVQEATK